MNLDFERGRAAERNRLTAILLSPEARGQMAFAAHLACSTDMSSAEALAALRQRGGAVPWPEIARKLNKERGL